MDHSSISNVVTAAYPDPSAMVTSSTNYAEERQSRSPDLSSVSSASSSSSESEQQTQRQHSRPSSRRSRMDRPRMGERQRSSSIIIPKGRDTLQKEKPEYPPDDARAMSPRRNSADLERLEHDVRQSLKEYAQYYLP